MVASHAASCNEAKGIATDEIQYGSKGNVSGLKDSLKTLKATLNRTIAIAKKSKAPELKRALTAYTQSSSMLKAVTDDPVQTDDTKQKKTTGKVLMIIGVALLLISFVLSSAIGFPVGIFAVSGILLLILGLIMFATSGAPVPPKNVPVPAQDSNN